MKVLVIGGGGREHAIAKQFNVSPSVKKVFVAPGNDGMKEDAEIVNIDATDFEALVAFAKENEVDLTFVGPEQPLAEGIVDYFAEQGLQAFGPTKAAAQIEGSKSFAKEIMKKYNIPTAAYGTFTDAEEAKAFIREKGAPIVVKADGLAAGKGVIVAMKLEDALHAVDDMIGNQKFGDSSSKVVIEEFLDGEEFSYMSFVHNGQIYPMVIAQDHKRAYDGDRGPNTGGMGAYSPVPQISDAVVKEAYDKVVVPTVKAMAAEGTPFTGILYAGLILTEDGPKVIEFNARFGDPEAQVVLPRMESDFGEFMAALMEGEPYELKWNDDAVLGVVIASEGYPDKVIKGARLPELNVITAQGLDVFHAGTKSDGKDFVGNGGRVLLVAARAETLKDAQADVYHSLSDLKWDGFFYRTDIGWRTFE
ncbi:phosphoribosylamine--glycine ligase [Sporosarcina pasteurii]|uniref:Phosphoribosylamine--glycine ligase n=1 Tax=Sporosarcina pasteurii TaxID=1474 RepID=A0A380CER3_SPOPA|nr:phosphoribosylamine--glycine ligase [Sporosarcina pasteurii]MDS9473154.1 phosphoribosylamine--glycine ligase [Sporosarcina pasteurii]QBQ06993.1 phosphoribosylamine--glycine ligase [Sporosarcina pasteurii]SUJ17491.1 Phosphoribosylamine--glycine ligase [Sporosarcina pasteurii]